ncbi:MAG: hypothetical protein ACE5I7_12670 [Candidatus Binatia bacterium]
MLGKIGRFVTGSSVGAVREATDALRQAYLDCAQRARQLSRHADMAPQAYSRAGLEELAVAEQAQAQRLREALEAAGATVPTAQTESLPGGALNHWARLVQDLESHRLSARHFRRLAVRFAEDLPGTAMLFDTLCREEQIHCERLRTLIARADPQALD